MLVLFILLWLLGLFAEIKDNKCIDHSEYTAKIKVIPKNDYPILMPCEF